MISSQKRPAHWLQALCIVTIAAASLATAHAETTVKVYRGLNAGPTGIITWDDTNFGVSGKPQPTLSFFNKDAPEFKDRTNQCVLVVMVHLKGNDLPEQGAEGEVRGIPGPTTTPTDGPWTIVFDNVPEGHWSISKKVITGDDATSNRQAGRYAAAGFRKMVEDSKKLPEEPKNATIEDGTVNGCQ